MKSSTFLYALIAIYLRPLVASISVNQTIDDQFGDSLTGLRPVFWTELGILWHNETCGECPIKPDITQVYKGTYTAGEFLPQYQSMGINMQFIGTAIYVFFTLANYQGNNSVTTTNANFAVDGKAPVIFTHIPDPTTTAFQYKALVFSQTNLPNTLHVLNITTADSSRIYVNFDYAIYTYEETVSVSSSTTTSTSQKSLTSSTTTTGTSPRTPGGAIAGGIIGGIVVLIFVISLLFCWQRRRGRDVLHGDRGNEDPAPLITEFRASPSELSAPRITDTRYTVHSKALVVTPPLANNYPEYSAQGGAGPSQQNKLPPLPPGNPSTGTDGASGHRPRSSHKDRNVFQDNTRVLTREDIRRERQEELDNRLRIVQREMEQVTLGPGGSLMSRRHQTLGATEGEVDLSVSDMTTEVRLMREQIRILREQRESSWAQGLSDDPPPGYTPMEIRTRSSREVLS